MKKYKVREGSIAWWLEGAIAPIFGVGTLILLDLLLYAIS